MLAKRILLTNDPEILRPMENSLFRREGFSLLIASDGRQAFEIIEDHDPALAILDFDMLTEGGAECCRRVKGDPVLRKTPIILVARAGSTEVVQRCRDAGCDEIIYRPVNPQDLLLAACRLLNIIERRDSRLTTALPALVGRDAAKLRAGSILNLNTGGAFVETRKLVPIDSELTLELILPPAESPHTISCRVAWVNHPEWIKALRLPVGMGLQFLDLPATVRAAIEDFLEKQEPSGPSPPGQLSGEQAQGGG
jgi:uncharacterized protein (TIGR02266 family)